MLSFLLLLQRASASQSSTSVSETRFLFFVIIFATRSRETQTRPGQACVRKYILKRWVLLDAGLYCTYDDCFIHSPCAFIIFQTSLDFKFEILGSKEKLFRKRFDLTII
jgi:hypothetical protein